VRDGNTIGECTVPTLDSVVGAGKISDDTIVNVPKLVIEEWFLASDPYMKKI
jgi:hypothetical protein